MRKYSLEAEGKNFGPKDSRPFGTGLIFPVEADRKIKKNQHMSQTSFNSSIASRNISNKPQIKAPKVKFAQETTINSTESRCDNTFTIGSTCRPILKNATNIK